MSHDNQYSRVDEELQIAHAGGLARWAGMCARHPWRVVFSWLATTLVLIVMVATLHGTLANEFSVPGTDFQKATDLIKAKFGSQQGAALRVVMAAPPGESLDTPERKAAIAEMLQIAEKGQTSLDDKAGDSAKITDPMAPDSGQLSDSGRVAFFDAQFDRTGFELPRADVVTLEDQLRATGDKAGIQVEFTGEAESPPPSEGASSIIGLIVAFFILIVLFRSLVSTFVPLIFAIVAVASAYILLYLAARLSDFNTITPILVSMIGLGVGIDYTLFIVTRFRQMLHDGLTPAEAAAAAGATAGRAVIFAGTTVAISITGLAFIGIDFITKLGIGSALGVLTAVILANTLLPAVLALLGHKVDRWRMKLPPADDSAEGRDKTPIARWGRFVTDHAKIVLPCVLVVLCILAFPVISVRLGLADSSTAPKDQTTRKAYDLLSGKDAFGPGFTSPIPVVVDMRGDEQSATQLEEAMKNVPGVAHVVAPIYNTKDNTSTGASVAIINAYSKYAPQDSKTDDIVSQLRDTTIPDTLQGTDAQAFVSGQNAAFTDIGDRILSNSPKFLLYIIGVTFILLAMAFRSVVIALKAALTTLGSALVGFGVLVFVIQMGHGMGVIGLDRTGPIESFVPPIAFAIIFGLSMDYEVFLMSRVREEHVHGLDTFTAVRDGVSGVGRVIVAAALIMTSVFFAFMLNPDRVTKEFGLLLGCAILCDAFLMRMTLVPSLLALLGERSWAMPGWLDKILPNITIEPQVEGDGGGPTPQPAPAAGD